MLPTTGAAPREAPRDYDLIAFDVDGTLVRHRHGKVVWEVFNRAFGGDDSVNISRFRAYRAGEISYPEWVALDVGDWVRVGATRQRMAELIRAELAPTPGAEETLKRLAQREYRLAVISGTLDITLELLFPQHPFEVVRTNALLFDDEQRVCDWRATPYDMEGKADALVEIADSMQIPLQRTVFVGDNINDLYVMRKAGLAVAFEPKTDEVRTTAHHVLEGDMRPLAELLDDDAGREALVEPSGGFD